MSNSKDKLINAVQLYLNAVKEKINAGGKPILFEEGIVINGNSVNNYDIKILFEKHNDYKLTSAKVEVLVLDDDSNSPTYNLYINSEASITYGINPNGIVKVNNKTGISQTIVIKIFSPTVKK